MASAQSFYRFGRAGSRMHGRRVQIAYLRHARACTDQTRITRIFDETVGRVNTETYILNTLQHAFRFLTKIRIAATVIVRFKELRHVRILPLQQLEKWVLAPHDRSSRHMVWRKGLGPMTLHIAASLVSAF